MTGFITVHGTNRHGVEFSATVGDMAVYCYDTDLTALFAYAAACKVAAAALKTQRQHITKGQDGDSYTTIPAIRIHAIDSRYKQAAALSVRVQRDIPELIRVYTEDSHKSDINAYIAAQLADITDVEVQEYISTALLSYANSARIIGGHKALKRPAASLWAYRQALKAVNAYIHSNKREFYAVKDTDSEALTLLEVKAVEKYYTTGQADASDRYAINKAYKALGERERDLLNLLISGLSQRQAAAELGLKKSAITYRVKLLREQYTANLTADILKRFVK